jgi:hypothetical protein
VSFVVKVFKASTAKDTKVDMEMPTTNDE